MLKTVHEFFKLLCVASAGCVLLEPLAKCRTQGLVPGPRNLARLLDQLFICGKSHFLHTGYSVHYFPAVFNRVMLIEVPASL